MIIEVENITKKYGNKKVLDGVTFSAGSGEFIAVAGGNGCGKSTLLGILAGTLSGKGRFFADGEDLLSNEKKRSALVGFIPQSPPLFPELTAKDHLALFYGRKGVKKQVCSGIVSMLGIDGFLGVPVRKMSGGMKKRLSVACAVAHGPSVLLLDEVGAALDPECRESIYSYIDAFCSAGGIVISVTHDISEIMRADRCYALKDGRFSIVEQKEQSKLLEVLYS